MKGKVEKSEWEWEKNPSIESQTIGVQFDLEQSCELQIETSSRIGHRRVVVSDDWGNRPNGMLQSGLENGAIE